ncbi:MAG: hypothetical protein EAZ08_00410 [Cytophagales bacterium]|nr:MAG: hypothetical protein EAZ08_00410 [Cytophagales bacterium]
MRLNPENNKCMEKDWVLVYESPNEVRVEIVRTVLEDSQIPVVLMDKKDSSYQFGSYQLYVNQQFITEATKIIKHDLEFE